MRRVHMPRVDWRRALQKVKIKHIAVTISVPKLRVDLKTRRLIVLSLFESRFVPATIRYRIERKLHAAEVRQRFVDGKGVTDDYIEFDWEMQHASTQAEQHDLVSKYLDLGFDSGGAGFTSPVEKHEIIPPRSALYKYERVTFNAEGKPVNQAGEIVEVGAA